MDSKTITVRDRYGKLCGPTYPRRAKGLVKKGRAYFSGAAELRLAFPVQCLEDTIMRPDKSINTRTDLTPQDLLERIDLIVKDTQYMRQAFDLLEKIPAQADALPRAQAAAEMVREREKTNREAISLLREMYGDLYGALSAETDGDGQDE